MPSREYCDPAAAIPFSTFRLAKATLDSKEIELPVPVLFCDVSLSHLKPAWKRDGIGFEPTNNKSIITRSHSAIDERSYTISAVNLLGKNPWLSPGSPFSESSVFPLAPRPYNGLAPGSVHVPN